MRKRLPIIKLEFKFKPQLLCLLADFFLHYTLTIILLCKTISLMQILSEPDSISYIKIAYSMFICDIIILIKALFNILNGNRLSLR